MTKPSVCVYCDQPTLRRQLERSLTRRYHLLFPKSIAALRDLLNHREVACLIANPIRNGVCRLWEVRGVKEEFTVTPVIITCPCDYFCFVEACAERMADECVHPDEIKDLSNRVQAAINRNDFTKQFSLKSNNYPPRVRRALDITHMRFTKIKFAEEISVQLGISVTTFRKEFKQCTGTTFTQYLIQTKLLYAAYLAQNQSFTGKSIAHRCGFEDEHEFYRCFKRKLGLTLSQYRTRHTLRDFSQLFGSTN